MLKPLQNLPFIVSVILFFFGLVFDHTWTIWAASGVLIGDILYDLIHRKG